VWEGKNRENNGGGNDDNTAFRLVSWVVRGWIASYSCWQMLRVGVSL
jgi:hypothetical protein